MGKRQTSTSTSVFSSVIDAVSFFLSAIASLLYQATLPITQHVFSRCAILPIFLRSPYSKIRNEQPHIKPFVNVGSHQSQHCWPVMPGATR